MKQEQLNLCFATSGKQAHHHNPEVAQAKETFPHAPRELLGAKAGLLLSPGDHQTALYRHVDR